MKTVNDIVIRGLPVGGYRLTYRPVLELHRGPLKAEVEFQEYLERERLSLGLKPRPLDRTLRDKQIARAVQNASRSGIVGRVWIEDPKHPATKD